MTGYDTGSNNLLLSDGTFDYVYDNEGNRVSRTRISNDPADDKTVEYEWDYRNRLTRVVFKDNSNDVTKEVIYEYLCTVQPPAWIFGGGGGAVYGLAA
jgi:hypothetical protein